MTLEIKGLKDPGRDKVEMLLNFRIVHVRVVFCHNPF